MKLFAHRLTTTLVASTAVLASTVVAGLATAFGQLEVDQSRFIAIASPRNNGTAHQLLILEQQSDTRSCWGESGSNPVLVDPLLLGFDFTGICGRSTDSNGYSIRVNGEDFALRYSLRVVNRGGDLQLIGAPNNRTGPELLIARANGTTTSFARLNLQPDWRFTKRTFEGRTLGHVYLTYEGPFPPASATPVPTPSPTLTPTPTPSPTPTPTPSPSPTPTPSPSPSPTPSTFRDVSGDVYEREIQQAVQQGFIAGFAEDNTFRPLAGLTREQLVSMAISALDSVPAINITAPTQTSFAPYPDVDASRWSAAKIAFARQNNIISGYQDGTFRPTQPVTRAELMAILRRTAEYGRTLQGQSAILPSTQPPFGFADTSSHWAADVIAQMSTYCRVASPLNETGTAFFPNEPALRNYAAAATLRVVQCLGPTR